MTRRTSSRIAGFTFLFYIAAGIASMVLFGRAARGEGMAAKLAGIAQNATHVSAVLVLSLLMCFSALVLAVTLHAITRDEDRDLAMMGLVFRVGEGVLSAASIPETQRLLWLAARGEAEGVDPGAARALGAYLLQTDVALTGVFFAVGSTLFCYLLLRGRMIPIPMAWLGVIASVLLVAALPLQLAGLLRGTAASLIWLPMLAFEIPFAVWLLAKGAAPPARTQSP